MGSYTELKLKVKLKKNTPDLVMSVLKRVLIDRDLGLGDKVSFDYEDVFKTGLEHEFFECNRWYMLFCATNLNCVEGGKMYLDRNGNYIIDLHTEFKNYDMEISKFIDWIKPYVVGHKKKQYIGWKIYDGGVREDIFIER